MVGLDLSALNPFEPFDPFIKRLVTTHFAIRSVYDLLTKLNTYILLVTW